VRYSLECLFLDRDGPSPGPTTVSLKSPVGPPHGGVPDQFAGSRLSEKTGRLTTIDWHVNIWLMSLGEVSDQDGPGHDLAHLKWH
jgi:hypothetical protein